MKLSQKDNNNFDVTLQTKEKSLRGVCFSPEKMKPIKSILEASSPIKISNYRVKRNLYTQEDEVHISKRTKLSEPKPSEIDFNILEQKIEEESMVLTTVSDILANKSKTNKVNISGW